MHIRDYPAPGALGFKKSAMESNLFELGAAPVNWIFARGGIGRYD